MIRLFVALELPAPVKAALLAGMGGVIGARWQRDDQLHLTLRFIGEVDRHQAQDIAAALGRVNIVPMRLSLGQPGSFDRRGRLDSLWVGVAPQDQLAALARRIDRALVGVGLPAETRAFVPHITVARFGRTAGAPGGWPQQPIPALAWDAGGFALWESRLGHEGADYRVVARWP
jgi:2'-5' RNA ligase